MCKLDDPYKIRANLLFFHQANADAKAVVEEMKGKKRFMVNQLPRYDRKMEGMRV
jgi:hypothetical protein